MIDFFGIKIASRLVFKTNSTSTHIPGRRAPSSFTPTVTLTVPARASTIGEIRFT